MKRARFYSIFISYSSKDFRFVKRLINSLETAGFTVSIDKVAIKPGDSWAHIVERLLRNSRCVLVVLSPSSVLSKNVIKELAFAQDEGKRVIPIFRRQCEIPLGLRGISYCDFRADHAAGLAALMRALPKKRAARRCQKKREVGKHYD